MAEAAGDVVHVSTSRGEAEARRMGRAEAGQSRLSVRHPWGIETFYGTAEEVVTHMRKRVVEHEATDPDGP